MNEMRIGDQLIRYNRDLTRQAYSSIKTSGPEECGCTYCRNFIAQRHLAYPATFLAVLVELGIDAEKEDEVYEMGPTAGGALYGGWMNFAGRLIEPGERLVQESSGFQFYFASTKLTPRADFGSEAMRVEFTTTVPWIIKEHEP